MIIQETYISPEIFDSFGEAIAFADRIKERIISQGMNVVGYDAYEEPEGSGQWRAYVFYEREATPEEIEAMKPKKKWGLLAIPIGVGIISVGGIVYSIVRK